MYEYDDDEEGGRSNGRLIAMVVGVLALALIGWFVVKPRMGGEDAGGSVIPAGVESSTTVAGDGSIVAPPSTTTGDPTTSTVGGPEPVKTTQKPAPTTTTTTTAAPTTTRPAPTTAAPTTGPRNEPYATLPNGSPQPAVALFGPNSITLTGAVPDQAAKDRLQTLAVANAKPGQADRVDNQLTLNPAVPRNVGVRVVELTSVRFPEGSAEVMPPHAAELDRVVAIMNALPNITALIIGHADQRGDDVGELRDLRGARQFGQELPRGQGDRRRHACRRGRSARPTCCR